MMTCDDSALNALLDADEETSEFRPDLSAAAQHIESCARCQRRLAELAGDAEHWEQTQRWLSEGGITNPGYAESLAARDRWHRPVAWTDAMAKSLLSDASHPEMLGRIGRYDVERLIGSGGMGVVFKAYDTKLNRPVAVKLLAPFFAGNGAARQRFAREARAAAAVVDEHVVAIHNVESDGEVPFLVMKYIAGGSLQQRLDRDGPLDVCEVLRIGMQTAKGLAAAHAQGLIHRDVKPSNILLDEGVERSLLTDFGLARATDDASLTRSGFHPGTPHYMSPEQVRGEAIDGRSDLFGLGCVLYSLCTGHPPFRSETSYAVLRRITDDTPRSIRETNPDVPTWLEQMVMKLLAKSRDERFDSAEQIAELLEQCLAHVQQPTTTSLPEAIAVLAPQPNRRPPFIKFIAAAAFAFALIFAGVLIVLERNKDTLTIESDADNVPLRIQHNQAIANVTHTENNDHAEEQWTQGQRLSAAVIEFNHLHSKDGRGNPQQPLTQSEILSCLLWRMGNDELSDEVVAAVQTMLNTRERPLPAAWRLTGGLKRRQYEDGIIQTWEVNLETDGLSSPISIRQTAISPPEWMRTVSGTGEGGIEPIPLASVIESFNTRWRNQDDFETISDLALLYGLELPPLTLDEVLAAIALSLSASDAAGMDDSAFQSLQGIAATQRLPADVRFEFVPSIKNDIDQWFTTSLIRMLVPSLGNSESPYLLTVRRQFIDTDSNNPAATHWGKADDNGLQAGFRLVPAQRTYHQGQVVDIEFLYRSTTSKKVPATLPATFQFGKVSGIRLERVSFVRPKWPDGSLHTLLGNEPVVVRGHRMQFCFDSDEALKPGVNLKAMTRPEANHYVRIAVPNVGDGAVDELLDISDRLFFRIPPLTARKILPIFESHYYQHWGTFVSGHRRPEKSTPDPEFVDPFQIGVSLGPADKSRIPAYFPSGMQVTQVAPYSPAELAGIEVGDILLSWEGNQIYGDDPNKPFANYNNPNIRLREALARNAKSKGGGSFNMEFDLLDHRTGEVLRIAPWFGRTAGGGPNKAEVIRRLMERKRLREEGSGKD